MNEFHSISYHTHPLLLVVPTAQSLRNIALRGGPDKRLLRSSTCNQESPITLMIFHLHSIPSYGASGVADGTELDSARLVLTAPCPLATLGAPACTGSATTLGLLLPGADPPKASRDGSAGGAGEAAASTEVGVLRVLTKRSRRPAEVEEARRRREKEREGRSIIEEGWNERKPKLQGEGGRRIWRLRRRRKRTLGREPAMAIRPVK